VSPHLSESPFYAALSRCEKQKETIMNIWRAMWGFDGRISRKYFWLAGAVWFIGFLAIMFPLLHWLTGGQWISHAISDRQFNTAASAAALIAGTIMLYPSLAMSVKRLHDLQLSAWWCVPAFVPGFIDNSLPLANVQGSSMLGQASTGIAFVVALAYIIVLGFIRGTDGPNEYGDDPRIKTKGMAPIPA
jgi:uncharacterized membrane protein YhaH (DUF805 family)